MEVKDLRTSLELLKKMEGQLVETDIEVDPAAELAGVYRHVGAGGTVMRPTKIDGPAMLFHNIKGHKDAKVLIGLLASRERVAALLGCKRKSLVSCYVMLPCIRSNRLYPIGKHPARK